MARKQEPGTAKPADPTIKKKAAPKRVTKPAAGAAVAKAKRPAKAKPDTAALTTRRSVRAKVPATTLDAARAPVAAMTSLPAVTKSQVRSEAKKALKVAKKTAKIARRTDGLLSDLHVADVSAQLSGTLKSVGNQIAAALKSDTGRAVIAELLFYVAASLTKAADKPKAGDTRAAVLKAGAQIGAVAADAGARLLNAGRPAATQAAGLIEHVGQSATEGATSAVGTVAGAGSIIRDAATAAVGAVAEAADTAIRRRGKGTTPTT